MVHCIPPYPAHDPLMPSRPGVRKRSNARRGRRRGVLVLHTGVGLRQRADADLQWRPDRDLSIDVSYGRRLTPPKWSPTILTIDHYDFPWSERTVSIHRGAITTRKRRKAYTG
jgi:hypothetical protein